MVVMNTLALSVSTYIFLTRLVSSTEIIPPHLSHIKCLSVLPICYNYEIQKYEFYNRVDRHTYKKEGTLCKCNCTIGRVISHTQDAYEPTGHPGQYTKKFACIRNDTSHNADLHLQICSNGDLCQTDNLTDFGYDIKNLNYVAERIPRCICNRFRECVANKSNNDKMVNYYCHPKKHDDYENLPACKGEETYKVEFYSGTNLTHLGDKMDTVFKCKCEFERKISRLQRMEEDSHSPYHSTTVRRYYCHKKPELELKKCTEHQVAYRNFRYEYGKDRNNETYEETARRYCICTDGMHHTPRGLITKSKWTKPYDEVIEERCMKPIPTDLIKCKKNQVFLVRITRKNFPVSSSIGVNAYIYCICEHNRKSLYDWTQKMNRTEDEFIKYQEIESYQCEMDYFPKANESCKDFAICKEYDKDYTGTEEPGIKHVNFITTYCKCDKERVCWNAGNVERRSIFRCIEKKWTIQREYCGYGEIDRVDINQTKINDDGTIEIEQINTFMCPCGGNLKYRLWVKKVTVAPIIYQDENHNHTITQHFCVNDGKVKEDPINYCSYEEVCKTYHYMNRGSEEPNAPLITYRSDDCNCTFPRQCVHGHKEWLSQLVRFKCDLGEKNTVREPKLRLCDNKGEFYKIEVERSYAIVYPSGVFPTVRKMNTILLCKCELIFYQGGEVHTPHPVYENLTVYRNFGCPPNNRVSDPYRRLSPCEDYTICREETYTEYGAYVSNGMTYLSNNYTTCKCDRNRVCNLTEQGHQRGDDTWTIHINTYRCIYKEDLHDFFEPAYSTPCLNDQKFLVIIREKRPDMSEDVLNTFVKCKCKSAQHYKFEDMLKYLKPDVTLEPTNPLQEITYYLCTIPRVDPRQICGEHDDCYRQYHVYGGRERGRTVFLKHHEYSCKCPNPQFCIPTIAGTAKCKEDKYGTFSNSEEE